MALCLSVPGASPPTDRSCPPFLRGRATGALLIFEQGKYFPPGLGTLWPPFAGMFVGERVGSGRST